MNKYFVMSMWVSVIFLCSCMTELPISTSDTETQSLSGTFDSSATAMSGDLSSLATNSRPFVAIIGEEEGGTVYIFNLPNPKENETIEFSVTAPFDWEQGMGGFFTETGNITCMIWSHEYFENDEMLEREFRPTSDVSAFPPSMANYRKYLEYGFYEQTNGFRGYYIITETEWIDTGIYYNFLYCIRLSNELIIFFEFESPIFEPDSQRVLFESVINSVYLINVWPME